MISSKDRSNYFGASDTKYIIGNWETKTFNNWWLTKIGIVNNNFSNESTMAGTYYEHNILDSLNVPGMEKDKQIIVDRLRVNLDGNTKDKIYEVKTFRNKNGFNMKKHKEYFYQVQTQMYISKIYNCDIVAYGLLEEDYKNYFNKIDKERLNIFHILYNEDFIKNIYLPKLNYLTVCIKNGRYPSKEEFVNGRNS